MIMTEERVLEAEPVRITPEVTVGTENVPVEQDGHATEPNDEEEKSELLGSASEAQTVDSIRVYLNAIARVALLAKEEEVDLSRRVEAGLLAGKILALRHSEVDAETIAEGMREAYTPGLAEQKKMGKQKWAEVERQIPIRVAKDVATLQGRADDKDGLPDEDLKAVEADGRKAKDHLIEANLRLVVSIAKRYRPGKTMTFMDFVDEGNGGLIHAIEMFDYAKGYKISTYATLWIRQAIGRALEVQDQIIDVPFKVRQKIIQLSKRKNELAQQLGKEPTAEDLARDSLRGLKREATEDELQEAYAEVLDLLAIERLEPFSYDQPAGEGDEENDPVINFLADKTAGAVVAREEGEGHRPQNSELWALIEQNWHLLDDRERLVLELLCGAGDYGAMNMMAISKHLGLSHTTISNTLIAAKAKLARPLATKMADGDAA